MVKNHLKYILKFAIPAMVTLQQPMQLHQPLSMDVDVRLDALLLMICPLHMLARHQKRRSIVCISHQI